MIVEIHHHILMEDKATAQWSKNMFLCGVTSSSEFLGAESNKQCFFVLNLRCILVPGTSHANVHQISSYLRVLYILFLQPECQFSQEHQLRFLCLVFKYSNGYALEGYGSIVALQWVYFVTWTSYLPSSQICVMLINVLVREVTFFCQNV
jgi:hypothetical protein